MLMDLLLVGVQSLGCFECCREQADAQPQLSIAGVVLMGSRLGFHLLP